MHDSIVHDIKDTIGYPLHPRIITAVANPRDRVVGEHHVAKLMDRSCTGCRERSTRRHRRCRYTTTAHVRCSCCVARARCRTTRTVACDVTSQCAGKRGCIDIGNRITSRTNRSNRRRCTVCNGCYTGQSTCSSDTTATQSEG